MFQWYGVTFVEDDWSTWWDFPENLCPETAQRYPPSLWQVTMINTAFTCGCIQYYRYCFHHFLCLRNFKILHLFFNYRGATERIFSINSNSGEAWRKLGVEKVECCLHVLDMFMFGSALVVFIFHWQLSFQFAHKKKFWYRGTKQRWRGETKVENIFYWNIYLCRKTFQHPLRWQNWSFYEIMQIES